MKYPVTGPSRIAVHCPIVVHSAIFSQLLGPLFYYTAVHYSDPQLYSGPRSYIGPRYDHEKTFMFEVFFVMRNKGRKLKKRTKEEEIGEGPVVYPGNAFDGC